MFDNLLGHQENKDLLVSLLHSPCFPNVLLLYGHAGVGKSDFARAISKAIIGISSDQAYHPDYLEFFPDTKTCLYSMNGIRSILREAGISPFNAKCRVFLIHQLECIEEGANALLKTFEEPPGYMHFICTTSKKESILPTLLSRMQMIAFKPLSLEEIAFWIGKRYKKSKSDIERIALFSSGSLTKAKLFCEMDVHMLFSLLEKLFLSLQEQKHFSLYERIENLELFIAKAALSLEDLYECIITFLQVYSLPNSHLILERSLQLSNQFFEANKKFIRKKNILEWFFFSLFSHIGANDYKFRSNRSK